jgi:hypothetical protein
MKGAIENIDVPADDAGELDQGQDTASGGEGQERELTPREKALNEIARQNNELNGIVVPESEDHDDDLQQTQQQAAVNDPLQELGYYKNEAGVLVTKMKINGVEREVPASQVKAYLQKEIAGDQRLQQAAERERQLQKKEQEIAQRETQLKSTLAKPQPPTLGVEEAERQAKEFYQNFWHGSEEEAVKAIQNIMRRDNATVDADQIAEQAAAKTMSKIEQQENQKRQQVLAASVDKGNELLKRDFPEVHADPRVFSLVNAEVDRLAMAQKSGDPALKEKLPEHLIVQAATHIREFLGRPLKKPGTPQDGSRADRKAGLKPVVRGRSIGSDPRKEPQIDTSPAAVVARMKGARVATH